MGYAGTGELTITGAGSSLTSIQNTYVGNNIGSQGTVTIQNGGSLTSDHTIVGSSGTGSLTIAGEDSLLTSSIDTIVAFSPDGQGTVTIEDAGSLTTNRDTYVGFAGTGELTIVGNGSSLTNPDIYVGNNSGSDGTVTIQDGGSLTSTNSTVVGNNSGSQGTVTIQNGGSLTSDHTIVGSSGTGGLTIAGENSLLTSNFDTIVAFASDGQGTVTIQNGGSLTTNRDTYVGFAGTGELTIVGNGSSLTNPDIYVGNNSGSDGTVIIQNGGSLTSTNSTIVGNNSGSVGTLNIGAAANDIAASPGILNGPVTFGSGTGTLNFNHTADNYVFSNNISGAGTLNIYHGKTILSGDNSSYSGDTYIHGGIVSINDNTRLGNGGALTFDGDGSGILDITGTTTLNRAIHLQADGTIHTGNNAVVTIPSVIDGTGHGLTKTGAGLLELTGTNTYTGATNVEAGELRLNGNLNSSHVTVANGASLSGIGSMGWLESAGRTAPGNSIGTLHIANNLTFTSAHVYACEVNAAGESDLIQVNGTASLNGSVLAIPLGNNYKQGKTYRYHILSAGIRQGTFTSVTSASNLYKLALEYQGNNVYLLLEKIAKLADGLKGTAGTIGTNLDNIKERKGLLAQVYDTLGTVSRKELISGLNSLTGAGTTTITHVVAQHSFNNGQFALRHLHRPMLGNRNQGPSQFHTLVNNLGTSAKSMLSQMFSKPKNLVNKDARLEVIPTKAPLPEALTMDMGQASLWVNGTAQTIKIDASNRSDAIVPELNATSGRTQVGGDYQLTDKFKLGLMAGYGHTSYKHRHGYGNGKVNSYDIGTYGSYAFTPRWYVDGVLSYSYNRMKGSRVLQIPGLPITAYQKHHANQYTGLLETGYKINLPQEVTLTPFVGGGLVYLDESSYSETGAGNVGLNVKGQGRRHVQGHTGLHLSKLLMANKTQYYGFAKLSYTYRKMLGNADKVTSAFIGQPTSFTVLTGKKTHHMFSPGLGMTALFENDVYATLAYNGDFGKDQRSHEGFLKIGKKF